ncbi:Diaminopimelate epimerase [Buchnera aphidicola (Eriosoma grossulariae)]|uniref:diaminopimelate epimerase n=1 Tax=Buchnera aphidicola TaxID=9 RepID=UPI0034644A29
MSFTKMQALGNDFMVIDLISQKISLSKSTIINLSNRNLGVGFDQLLLVEKSQSNHIDFYYRIFNANGEEVSQCGNGARCFALFVHLKQLSNKKKISIATQKSHMICEVIDFQNVLVDMGQPDFIPKNIPFLTDKINIYYSLLIKKTIFYFGVVSFGNPHCVIIVDNINDPKINIFGPLIEKHHLFPENVNVGFVQIITPGHIKLRVYERGVGETKSCGSGACAAVAVGINQNLLSSHVQVDLIGGSLKIIWKGVGSKLYMTGSANYVYDGTIFITS